MTYVIIYEDDDGWHIYLPENDDENDYTRYLFDGGNLKNNDIIKVYEDDYITYYEWIVESMSSSSNKCTPHLHKIYEDDYVKIQNALVKSILNKNGGKRRRRFKKSKRRPNRRYRKTKKHRK